MPDHCDTVFIEEDELMTQTDSTMEQLKPPVQGSSPQQLRTFARPANRTGVQRPNTQFDFAKLGLQRLKNDGNTNPHEISEDSLTPRRPKRTYDAAATAAATAASPPRPKIQHLADEKPAPAPAHGSPWRHYEKLFKLQFGNSEYFTVAERTAVNPDESPVVIVKRVAGLEQHDRIQMIRKIKHKRFLRPREFFSDENACLVAFEFMPISIAEFAGHPLMNELRLASILGQVSRALPLIAHADGVQVIDGLAYLERSSMQHGQLKSSNILVDATGNVKLCEYSGVR
jgi:hypothetical protein